MIKNNIILYTGHIPSQPHKSMAFEFVCHTIEHHCNDDTVTE